MINLGADLERVPLGKWIERRPSVAISSSVSPWFEGLYSKIFMLHLLCLSQEFFFVYICFLILGSLFKGYFF